MSNGTDSGQGTVSFTVRFDIDEGTVGAGAAGLASPLSHLVAQAPAGTQAIGSWLPDLELSEAQAQLNIGAEAFGGYVAIADGDGNELASVFVFLSTATGQPEGAAGLNLAAAVDLAATPLFGALLSGVAIDGLTVSYASQDFAAGDITLPSGPGGAAQPYQAVPSGFGLTATVTAGGSVQPLALGGGGSGDSGTGDSGSGGSGSGGSGSGGSGSAATRPVAAQDSGGGPAVTWFAVQKSLGPLYVDRVGVAASAGTLALAIDASVSTDVVDIQLTGFTVAFTPSALTSEPPAVSLDGLAVAVDAGELQIAGSLTRTTTAGVTEYDGSLVIGIGSYAIDAAGSYTVVNGAPSLFVFGVAKGEFGGPPAFFVTGLAAGFGVNRALRLPTVDQVAAFPLVAAAAGTGASDILGALADLNSGGWVPPALGEYWVAAGVTFRSFELIDGVVLVTVEFGKDLVIALLGVAALKQPSDADAGDGDAGKPYAYVEIALEAVLRPREGVLSIEALLTPNSYLIDPSCQLTGGAAFYLWFGSNEHAGDFVVTVGGYHHAFVAPAWYPTVPRLGLSWHVSDALQVTGDCYFALTPQCVMGGGLLSVTFAAGGLSAWFTAQADFIMYWRPFWFDVAVSISIGISYTGSVGFISATFTVELGVSVELWGPPLAGIAHVHWWVVSFDVPINGGGSPGQNPATLADWDTFAKTSLPRTTTSPPQTGTVCQPRPAAGLQSVVTTAAGETVWQFGGDALGISSETVIPASQVSIAGPAATALPGLAVSVYPLGNVQVTSIHEVRVCTWTGTTWQAGQPVPAGLDVSGWGWAVASGNLPAALWGPRGNQTGPTLNGAAVVSCVTGAAGTGQATIAGGLTVAAGVLSLTAETPRGLALGAGPLGGPGPTPAGDTRTQVAATIDAPDVAALRAAVISAANKSGVSAVPSGGTLPLLAAEVYAVLTDQPMLGPVGSTGPPATTATTGAATAGPPATAAAPATPTSPETAAPPAMPTAPTWTASKGGDPARAGADRGPALRALFRRGSTGTPTLAAVADHWSTTRESRLLAAEGGEGSAARLAAGAVAVWDLAVWDLAGDERRTLRCDPAGPLWIVALDRLQRPSQSFVTRLADPGSAVPEGTTRVAVSAPLGPGTPQVAGWHGGTVLRQIGSQALLGGGAVVRPQSPYGVPRRGRRRHRRTSREFGVVTARDLVERNWTQGPDGHVWPGWIETFLPSWCRAVVVALVPTAWPDETGDGSADVTAPWVAGWYFAAGESRPAGFPVETVETRRTPGAALWLYLVGADGVTRPGDQLVVRARAPQGWRLDGVYGFAERPADFAAWPPGGAGPADLSGSEPTGHAAWFARAGGPAGLGGSAGGRVWWE